MVIISLLAPGFWTASGATSNGACRATIAVSRT
jgi:hypothetical protein